MYVSMHQTKSPIMFMLIVFVHVYISNILRDN